MAKNAHKNQSVAVVDHSQNEVVEQENMTPEEFIKQAARKLTLTMEMETAKAHEQARGQGLPYRDIIWAVNFLMDAAGVNRAAVQVLSDKVPQLLKVKYAQMGNGTNEVVEKVGSKMVTMKNNELRALREAQLAHMQDPKVKDNFYRRIYGLGYRKEFKTFELKDGDIIRKVKTEEDNPQE
jgi:hypothetical protein